MRSFQYEIHVERQGLASKKESLDRKSYDRDGVIGRGREESVGLDVRLMARAEDMLLVII